MIRGDGVLLLQFYCQTVCGCLRLPNDGTRFRAEQLAARLRTNVRARATYKKLKILNVVLVLFLLVAFSVTIARTVLDRVRDKKHGYFSFENARLFVWVRSQLNLGCVCRSFFFVQAPVLFFILCCYSY